MLSEPYFALKIVLHCFLINRPELNAFIVLELNIKLISVILVQFFSSECNVSLKHVFFFCSFLPAIVICNTTSSQYKCMMLIYMETGNAFFRSCEILRVKIKAVIEQRRHFILVGGCPCLCIDRINM